jgi:signal recognition particle receptor subunit beta
MATLNYAFKELSCKIVYYGCGLCGKTTNLIHIHKTVPEKFRGDLVSLATEQDRTLFFDFLPLDLGEVKGFKTKFQLYTVPGQVYYNATRKLVLRGVDGLVFVADSQRDRFQENIESLENLKQNLTEYGYHLAATPDDYDGIPWVIQYNKRDMPQVSDVEELKEALNPTGSPGYESVALSGKGVKDTLKGISSLVIKKLNSDTTSGSGLGSVKKGEKSGSGAQKTRRPAEAPAAPVSTPAPVAPAKVAAPPTPRVPAPAPAYNNSYADGPPKLKLDQKCKVRLRGVGMGSASLALENLAVEEPGIYQLTGKVSFLMIFGSTWGRKLRYAGKEEKKQNDAASRYHKFLSADDLRPSLEVYVKDDFNKTLFIEYVGKMGQVHILPLGMKPLN